MLKKYRHLKIFYLPYTDKAILFKCEVISRKEYEECSSSKKVENLMDDIRKKYELLKLDYDTNENNKDEKFENFLEANGNLTHGEIRSRLLAKNPLDPDFVRKVNLAELDFYIKSQGSTVDVAHK